MTSLLNFIKIYQLVQKLLGGDTQTDRQDGDLISLTFLFKESRLKIEGDCDYSMGRLQKFKNRHGIRYLKISSEKLSANHELAEEYVSDLSKLVQEHRLTTEQNYIMDETGLFWHCLPEHT
jgi:hypothetical protein